MLIGETFELPADQKTTLQNSAAPTPEPTETSPTDVPPATPELIAAETETPTPEAYPSPTATKEGLLDGLIEGVDGTILLIVGALVVVAFFIILLLIFGVLKGRRKPAARRPTAPMAPAPAAAPPPVPVAAPPAAVPSLVMALVSDPARQFPVVAFPFTIGRAKDNTLVIDETFPRWETVSRHHAVITQGEVGYIVEDQGSQNGIRVNDRPTVKNLLRDGWKVTIGGVEFTFHVSVPANAGRAGPGAPQGGGQR